MSDTAKFVRAISTVILAQPDGTVTMTRAAPIVLQPVLWTLASAVDQAQTLIDQLREVSLGKRIAEAVLVARWMALTPQERDRQLGQLQDALDAFVERLDVYRGVTDQCVAQGKLLDWRCTLYPVAFPALLGWYPNEDGTAIDPQQTEQALADMATPLVIIEQIRALGVAMDWQGFAAFLATMIEVSVDAVASAGMAAAQWAIDAAKQAADEALKNPNKPAGKLARWGLLAAGGALVVGGYVLLK